MFLRISVALLLSSQKPGLCESCFSSAIFCCRLATSKKPPYTRNAGPHIIQFFDCHGAKIRDVAGFWILVAVYLLLVTNSKTLRKSSPKGEDLGEVYLPGCIATIIA